MLGGLLDLDHRNGAACATQELSEAKWKDRDAKTSGLHELAESGRPGALPGRGRDRGVCCPLTGCWSGAEEPLHAAGRNC